MTPGRLDVGGHDPAARRQSDREPGPGPRRCRSLRCRTIPARCRDCSPRSTAAASDWSKRSNSPSVRAGHQPAGRGRSVRGAVPLSPAGRRFGGSGHRLRQPAADRQRAGRNVRSTSPHDALGLSGRLLQIPGLAEAVNDGEYLIPRLLRDQKRDAIEKPIGVGGAKISPRLVQRLLNDVGDDPDQLPVLQHALMRTWDVWSAGSEPRPADRLCRLRGDRRTGGGAVHHADEIFDALPDDAHRRVCERSLQDTHREGRRQPRHPPADPAGAARRRSPPRIAPR